MKKLNWGLIGGGEGSQIGLTHLVASTHDNYFNFVAGALDIDTEKAKKYGVNLGLAEDRAYGSWQEMLEGEKNRPDKIDLVTIATPNSTHFEITKAFLENGFHVMCEKPLTMTSEEARQIVEISQKTKTICAVNYGYTGYPMVIQARHMVQSGQLGKIRLIVSEFAHGHHSDAADMDNPRIRWRYDPKLAGNSSILTDCGIHALNMATFVTGQKIQKLSADFASCVEGRKLEDDAMINYRMDNGIVGRLWTSAVALGNQHGLTIKIFGENGSLKWSQEQPNQLYYTPLNQPTQILERGMPSLCEQSLNASRVTAGHTEGFLDAFANLYMQIAKAIYQNNKGEKIDNNKIWFPTATDGKHSIDIVEQAVKSAKNGSKWLDII